MVELTRLEELATARLDPAVADYVNRGSGPGLTKAANLAAWRRWSLRPHVLRDVSTIVTVEVTAAK